MLVVSNSGLSSQGLGWCNFCQFSVISVLVGNSRVSQCQFIGVVWCGFGWLLLSRYWNVVGISSIISNRCRFCVVVMWLSIVLWCCLRLIILLVLLGMLVKNVVVWFLLLWCMKVIVSMLESVVVMVLKMMIMLCVSICLIIVGVKCRLMLMLMIYCLYLCVFGILVSGRLVR